MDGAKLTYGGIFLWGLFVAVSLLMWFHCSVTLIVEQACQSGTVGLGTAHVADTHLLKGAVWVHQADSRVGFACLCLLRSSHTVTAMMELSGCLVGQPLWLYALEAGVSC